MPLEIGGLNLDPPAIGYIIGSYGAGSAIFQAFYFAKAIRRFGEKRVFVGGMSIFVPVFLLFPMINQAAQRFGQQSLPVLTLLFVLLCLLAVMDVAYGKFAIFFCI